MDMDEVERKIETLEKKLDNLPEQISNKINETMNLKIENAMQGVKIDFYKWLVPIILGLLGTLTATIFSYIR